MKKQSDIQWYEVRLTNVGELRGALINRLFELGVEGVFEPEKIETVLGYCLEDRREIIARSFVEYLASLRALFPFSKSIGFEIVACDNKDWSKSYRDAFRAQPIAKRFFLIPLWDTVTRAAGGRIPLIMEAGQAFGTGLHATTQLCLTALETIIADLDSPENTRLLDVGTGTGILGIAAEKLGVGSVYVVDNDPVAVEQAQLNFERNHCRRIRVFLGDLSTIREPFNIVVANILLETHRDLADQYKRLVAPGGVLLISGLLGGQREEMSEYLRELNLVAYLSYAMQEWVALGYRHSRGVS